jgi:hypothetical protein
MIECSSCDESGKDLIERESKDKNKRVMCSPTPEEYSEEESIGCQSSYESEISYQEQHDREKDPSMDTHEETSCSQLADVFRADKGKMEELEVQFISCLKPVNEKISPRISRPASVLYPPVHSENIEQWVRNNEVHEVISYQLSFPDYKFFDPVGLYMELCFPKALEPAKLFILSSFGGISSFPIHVFFVLSYFPYLLWIICRKEKNFITEQSGWLWWKFAFT